MAVASIETLTSSNTFSQWLDTTNELVTQLRDHVITAETGSYANTDGDARLNGEFVANTVSIVDELRGGMLDPMDLLSILPADLIVTTNTVFTDTAALVTVTNETLMIGDVEAQSNVSITGVAGSTRIEGANVDFLTTGGRLSTVRTDEDGSLTIAADTGATGLTDTQLTLSVDNIPALEITKRDVRFSNDLGTLQNFYWDSTSEHLGIHTAAPSVEVDVTGNTHTTDLTVHQLANTGTLRVRSNATIDNNLTTNNVTTSNTLVVEHSVTSDLVPTTDSVHNIGNTTNRWATAWIDDVTVTNDGAIGNNLNVANTVTIGKLANTDMLRVRTDGVVDNNLTVSNTAFVSNNLNITNQANTGTLRVRVDGSVERNLVVTANTSIGLQANTGTLRVRSNATIDNNLTTNNVTTSNTLVVEHSVTSDLVPTTDSAHGIGNTSNRWVTAWIDDVTVTNDGAIGNNLNVANTATISKLANTDTLRVRTDGVVDNNLTVSNTAFVSNNLNITNQANTNTLRVRSNGSVEGSLTVTNTTTSSQMNVGGQANTGTLRVRSNGSIEGSLNITSQANTGTLRVRSNGSVEGSLNITSQANTGTLRVRSNGSVEGSLTVTNTTTSSQMNVSGQANTNTLRVRSTVDTNIIPSVGTLSIGNTTNAWQHGYFNTVTTDSLISDSLTVGSAANKASIAYTTNTARTYTIPDVAASSFVMTAGAQTINGTKTFGSMIVGDISGNAGTVTHSVTAADATHYLSFVSGSAAGPKVPLIDGGLTYNPANDTLNVVNASFTGTVSLPGEITLSNTTFENIFVNANTSIHADPANTAATHIPVFTASPGANYQVIKTRTPSLLMNDLGAHRTIKFIAGTYITPSTTSAQTLASDRTWALNHDETHRTAETTTASSTTTTTTTATFSSLDSVTSNGTGHVTASVRKNWTIPAATTLKAGVMTSSDKSKLNGIEAGAEVNVGTNLGTSATSTARTVSSSTGNNTTLPAANTTQAGVMTSAEHIKLSGIEPGAEVNVPPGNGQLTLQVNGTTRAIFYANQPGPAEFNIPAASGLADGVVTGGAQTFNGNKTFTGYVIAPRIGSSGTATLLTTDNGSNTVITLKNNGPGGDAVAVSGRLESTGGINNDIGNSSGSGLPMWGNLYLSGEGFATDFTATSDASLKENIRTIETAKCLEKIKQLKPSYFTWKETGKEDTGLIAQDVQEVLPERVKGDDTLSVSYGKLTTHLIGAVQEQQKTIEQQQAQIDKLTAMVELLMSERQ